MTNLQLSQKSFKTCLGKLTIIAPFIPRNNLLFGQFFFYNFLKLPPNKCQRGAVYIFNAFREFLKRMKPPKKR